MSVTSTDGGDPPTGATFSSGEPAEPATGAPDLAVVDLLVEEVSIDGMCGVY